MDHLAFLNANPMPLAELIGLKYVSAEPDKVVGQLLIRPDLCTLAGTMHGGCAMAFADSLGAAATIINLPEGAGTTTIESKTNFLSGAREGTVVTGTATPIHKGRRTQVWQTAIHSEEGKLVALVTQTQIVLEKRA